MDPKKLLPLILLWILATCAYAQKAKVYKKSITNRSKFSSNYARLRGSKSKIPCPVFDENRYPYEGIGFKLGDPVAATLKFYLSPRISFAADFGKPASGLYNRTFREEFATHVADTVTMPNASLQYLTHRVKSDLVFEMKVMYHINASQLAQGLQAYVGAGWQWKTTKIQYNYVYDSGTPDYFDDDKAGSFSRSRLAVGPQAVVGIEYAYFKLPVSAFMELEYFANFQVTEIRPRVEGGVGLRYIF